MHSNEHSVPLREREDAPNSVNPLAKSERSSRTQRSKGTEKKPMPGDGVSERRMGDGGLGCVLAMVAVEDGGGATKE